MRKTVLLLLLLFSANLISSTAGKFNEGIEYYKAGNFDEALRVFKELENENAISSGLLYNIGNCHFRKGRLGEAILYYERAKKADPADEDILQNLRFTNSLIKERVNEIPLIAPLEWWIQVSAAFSVKGWVYLLMGVFYPLILLLVLRIFFGRRSWPNTIMISCCVVTIFLLSLLSYTRYSWIDSRDYAIVVQKSVEVLSAPEENGNPVFKTAEGIKVRIDDKVGDWWKVRLPDGRVGWLKSGEIEVI